MQHTNDPSDGQLYIRIYAGQDATFEYYEDEGDSYRYENGEYATVSMKWDEEKQSFTLDERKGTYPGMPQEQKITVLLYAPDAENEQMSVSEKSVTYTGQKLTVLF